MSTSRTYTSSSLRFVSLVLGIVLASCRQQKSDGPDGASVAGSAVEEPKVAMPKLPPSSAASSAGARVLRPLSDLVNASDPGWPVVSEMIGNAKNKVEVLTVDPKKGAQALLAIQVTTRSPMGAIAYSSGGLMVDRGWVRVLGGGHARLPRDIGSWNFPNGMEQPPRLEGAMLVADDALGGFFAVNGGAFEGPAGNVFYLAPDSLRWEDMGRGYTDFLQFLLQGDLAKFYEGQRWKGWALEVEKISGDRAYSVFPFLWAKEGGTIDQRSRKDVPVAELWTLHAIDLPKQLASAPDGGMPKMDAAK